ncbi:hypothetical protein EDC62_2504 [Tibeticola sediminis]|jgi:hypothetical protein|uniref:Uncharacterized protein n=1 Tax=Tibeticola sediminis TaxID=1917811 RepID=A0A3N4U7V4_9BURK|nr:hypothetical protein [Tibeticola sediminis]RPE63039.1 hypothetical protein EDC62_2504 [Tibeticola sediminis]
MKVYFVSRYEGVILTRLQRGDVAVAFRTKRRGATVLPRSLHLRQVASTDLTSAPIARSVPESSTCGMTN